MRERSFFYGCFVAVLLAAGLIAVTGSEAGTWRYSYPYPQGNDLQAVWASGPNDVFMGGQAGTILHWDGANWTKMTTPTQMTIYSIGGVSSTDVWAVGGDNQNPGPAGRCVTLHYNGQNWTSVTPPNFSGWTYPLSGLTAIASNDVWATNNGGPSLVHWNGTAWSFDLLNISVEGSFSNTFALGANHVFAVGSHGQVIHRYNNAWHSEIKSETGNFSSNLLTDIWGTDLENIYAVGNWGQVYKRNANGTWTSLDSLFPSGMGNGFWGITGVSSSEMYLYKTRTLFSFDGVNPPKAWDYENSMRSQWYSGYGTTDGIYFGGPYGAAYKFNYGETDKAKALSTLTAGGPRINQWHGNMTACGQDGVLLYGWGQKSPAFEPLLYFDGTVPMRPSVIPDSLWRGNYVQALASSVNDITVTWTDNSSYDSYSQHWDGQSWTSLASYTPQARGLWRSPTGKLYLAANYGVYRYNAASQSWGNILPYEETPLNCGPNCIWGKSDSEIYVGLTANDTQSLAGGQIMRYNGSTWTRETTSGVSDDLKSPIKAICGTGSDIYAVGNNGNALRHSGTTWTQLSSITPQQNESFYALAAGTDGVYASMETTHREGRLLRMSGTTVTTILDHCSETLQGIAKTGSGTLYGLGSKAGMMTDAPMPSGFWSGLVDTDNTQWTSLGTTGIDLQFTDRHVGKQYLAAWRTDRAPGLFDPLEMPGKSPVGQLWTMFYDLANKFSAFPDLMFRLTYNPSLFPVGLTPAKAGLFRQDGTGWSAKRSSVNSAQNQISTSGLTPLSAWTISESPVYELPLNVPRLIEMVNEFPGDTVGSEDLFRRSPTWMQPE